MNLLTHSWQTLAQIATLGHPLWSLLNLPEPAPPPLGANYPVGRDAQCLSQHCKVRPICGPGGSRYGLPGLSD